MNKFVKQLLLVGLAIGSLLLHQQAMAEERNQEGRPWEKLGANVGVFFSSVDSSLRFGSGIGIDVDVEQFLGLDTTNTVFRTEALWRLTDNRRHRLDLSWFAFRRDGSRQILEDITIERGNGDQIVIPAGTKVKSHFNLDIFELAYSYSFLQDDRVDLAAGLGMYIMPIDFGIVSRGLAEVDETERFTAPLPALALRMDIALTPRWFIRSGAQVFYLEYENFTGSMLEFRAAVEYNPWRYVGIGLGLDSLGVRVEADGSTDWPGVDLNGTVEFNYVGLQLYLRLFY